jgi:MtN3 and saliva related transmembrane protein
MTSEWSIAIIGSVAACLTTGAFLPQIVKMWRQGGRDLSYGMLVLYLVGVLLWLFYGLMIGARAVIAANAVTAVLVAFALGLKVRLDSASRPRVASDREGLERRAIAPASESSPARAAAASAVSKAVP